MSCSQYAVFTTGNLKWYLEVISVSCILYNLFPFFDWLLPVALYVIRRCCLNLVHGVSLLRFKARNPILAESQKTKDMMVRHDALQTIFLMNQSINQWRVFALCCHLTQYHDVITYCNVMNNTQRYNLKIQLSIQPSLVLIYSPSKPIEKPPSNANIAQANANQHSEIGSKYY